MKRNKMTVRLIAISVVALLLNMSNVLAQGVNRYLTLGNSTTTIDNLFIADSVSAGKSVVYTAEFDIIPSDATDTKLIISELMTTCTQRNTIAVLILRRLNTNMEVEEERVWNNVTVEEMILPEMDASSRTIAKFRIKIKAAAATVTFDKKTKIVLSKTEVQRSAISSAYRFRAGTLPTNRISKISSMTITSKSMVPLTFFIELSVPDSKEWTSWFINGAGNTKKEQGALELLGPDMRSAMMEINLGDLEIISYSTSYSSNQQTIQRVTIGLRTQSISINRLK